MSKIELISPEGMFKNPAFSQLATVEGPVKTVYIGGQNAVDKNGKIVGSGDIEAQARQVLDNLETALKAGGASFEQVIKYNLYVVEGQAVEKAHKVFQERLGKMKKPPLITMAFVAGLGNPEYLMELEAIAVVPMD